ncbi:MAG: DUF2971 domain-containing protein [Endomicrobium sp.]|jgi:hypothetical protein|nr:DUF2971 domain-containing protein [Endomicrobium sp.]
MEMSITKRNNNQIKIIYHYSPPEALESILSHSTIRFTDCQFLDDKAEFLPYMSDILDEVVNLNKNAISHSLKNILTECQRYQIYSAILPTITKPSINVTKSHISLKNSYRYYVFCASKDRDSISMWNYYIKNDKYQGYNIGFSVNEILTSLKSLEDKGINIFHGSIIYDRKKQKQTLNNLIKELNSNKSYDFLNFRNYIKGEIDKLRLFFKQEAFSNEKEYRFILRIPNSENNIKNRIKNGVFVPYYEATFDKKKDIKSICCSPRVESELAKQGLHTFLYRNGYTVYQKAFNLFGAKFKDRDGVKLDKSSISMR